MSACPDCRTALRGQPAGCPNAWHNPDQPHFMAGQVMRPGHVRPERPTAPPPLPPTSGGFLGTPGQADIDRLYRRTVQDAEAIADLYERITWLSQPWRKRAFRRPPWLGRPVGQ